MSLQDLVPKFSYFLCTALQGLPFELNRKVFSDDLDVSMN